MAARDLRRWLPPAGIAALVALTVLDVVLIKLAFDHAAGPPTSPSYSSSSSQSASPRAESPEPSPSPAERTSSGNGGSGTPTGSAIPGGPLLLALAADGTALLSSTGGCESTDGPEVAVVPPGSDDLSTVPVSGLSTVLALQAERRDQLAIVGADAGCEAVTYRGGAQRRNWVAAPAQSEWYLDTTVDAPEVHAPGGPVEVPCTPASLSTVGAIRLLCDDGGLVGSADGGETWATLGRLEEGTAFAFQGPANGFALVEREDCPVTVLSTVNGGAGWETAACLDGRRGRAVAVRDNSLVAVADDTLWRSADAGVTWEQLGG